MAILHFRTVVLRGRSLPMIMSLVSLALAIFVIIFGAYHEDKIPVYAWFFPVFINFVSLLFGWVVGRTSFRTDKTIFQIEDTLKEGDAEKIKEALFK